MDTNQQQNKNLQMNTFSGGMDTDTSDMYIKDTLYRYAENVRIITQNENNSGELRLVEGTKPLYVRYIQKQKDGGEIGGFIEDGEIIALESIRDMAIMITKEKVPSTNKYCWCVYKFIGNEIKDVLSTSEHKFFGSTFGISSNDPAKLSRSTEASIIYRIVGPIYNKNEEDDVLLWNDSDIDVDGRINKKLLSIVLRWENDNNIKAYIADGKHQTLVLQVAENYYQGNEFEKLFLDQELVLMPLQVQWSTQPGSIIGPVIQYAYRVYKKNGQASSISLLSDPLVDYKNGMQGHAPNKSGDYSVKINIPSINIDEDQFVLIFRISYQKMANAPTIHLIYDNVYKETDIYDRGSNIEEVSEDEFLSFDLLKIKPKQLESKGDYLFSANVNYVVDEVDELFKDFDARCYTSATRLDSEDGELVLQDGEVVVNNIPKELDFYHPELTVNSLEYDLNNWVGGVVNNEIYNGIGKTLAWKYIYKRREISSTSGDTSNSNEKGRTYRRGDVYRFGIILYDKHGNKSSVKWIADIKMPPANTADVQKASIIKDGIQYIANVNPLIEEFNNNGATNEYSWSQYDIGIEFEPIGSNDEGGPWKDVYGYLIVQCPRNVADKHILFLGISGFPLMVDDGRGRLIHPGYLTACNLAYLNIWTAPADFNPWGGDYPYDVIYKGWTFRKNFGTLCAHSDVGSAILLFACPEYSLQKDDVKEILNSISGKLKLQTVDIFCTAHSTTNAYLSFEDKNGIIKYLSPYLYGRPWTRNSSGTGPLDLGHRDMVYHSPLCSNFSQNPEGCNEYGSNYIPSDAPIYYGGSAFSNIYMFDTAFIDYMTRWAHWSKIAYNVTELNVPELGWDDPYFQWSLFPYRLDMSVPLGGSTIYTNRYSFVTPKSKYPNRSNQSFIDISKDKEILSCSYTESPSPSSFGTKTDYYSQDHLTSVEDKLYINWHAPVQYCYGSKASIAGNYNAQYMAESHAIVHGGYSLNPGNLGDESIISSQASTYPELIAASQFPIGAGGDLILFKLNQGLNYDSVLDIPGGGLPPIWIQNVVNTSALPYGGYNFNAVDNSTYIDTPVLTKRDKANRQFESLRCFYGDCCCKPFIYYATHYWRNYDVELNKVEITYIVPIESEVDLQGNASIYISPTEKNGYDVRLQDQPSSIGGFNQTQPVYLYNTAYGIIPSLFARTPESSNVQSNNYDVRVHYSNNKTNGEYIDSWTINKPSDFLDVDSRYGGVNMLKLYKDKLLFWLDHATGILSANERTIINDEDSNAIQLGTGNVLERFDYFTTLYGMKPYQRSVAISDGAVYWWDGYQKEILNHVDGYTITPLATVKNVKNYINSYNESTIPSLMYDKKNKEVLLNVVNNDTLVYSEHIINFTSVYKFNPIFYCALDNIQIITPKQIESEQNVGGLLYLYNTNTENKSTLFNTNAYPKIQYVVNNNSVYNKVFDNQSFGGRFYQGDTSDLQFSYDTPLKLHAEQNGNKLVTDYEYDFKLAIPRHGETSEHEVSYGDRLRGKTMRGEIKSGSNDLDFSLQYIITKYRISWT